MNSKDKLWNSLKEEKMSLVQTSFHREFKQIFQTYFFYSFEENFKPEMNRLLEKMPNNFSVKVYHQSRKVIYESQKIDSGIDKYLEDKIFEPQSYLYGSNVVTLIPSDEYQFLYIYNESQMWWTSLILFTSIQSLGLLLLVFLLVMVSRLSQNDERLFFGLRQKLILLVTTLSFLTSGLIFFSLSYFQKKEHLDRVEKEFLVFSEFAVDRIILDFSQSFHFYYFEKFIPSIKKVISANPSLEQVRIISAKDKKILFDSTLEDVQKNNSFFGMNLQEENDILLKGKSSHFLKDINEREFYRVLFPFYSDKALIQKEPLYYVEFSFNLESFSKQMSQIKNQVLLDLVPSLLISIFLAFLFAHFLVQPIQKLIRALDDVKKGRYDSTVSDHRSDELGRLIIAFNEMSHELKKKEELKRFISHSSYQKIMEAADQQGRLKLLSTKTKATVLFCDIRNFVSYCESHEAEEVTSVLNEYFSEMVRVIAQFDGEIDKFIGDALLAVFHPISQQSEADYSESIMRALYCSLEMKNVLHDFNEKRKMKGKTPLENGVGISFGELIYGPIGASNRLDFTVIGDTVNRASRVEKISKKGKYTKILFSHDVFQVVSKLIECTEINDAIILGKSEELKVYELLRIKNFDSIINNYESGDSIVKLNSIDLLGLVHHSKAVDFLKIIILDLSQDGELRRRALRSLSQIAEKEDDELAKNLFQLLKKEKSVYMQSSLISCLGKVCSVGNLVQLKDWLNSDDERIVANTIEVISRSNDPAVFNLIFAQLESHSHRIKANAALVLFRLGKVEVIYILKPMLIHADPKMRASACFAIGELSRAEWNPSRIDHFVKKDMNELKRFFAEIQDTVPMLIALLKDKDSVVKKQALIALGKIKNKSAILALIDELADEDEEWLKDVYEVLLEIGVHPLIKQTLERKISL